MEVQHFQQFKVIQLCVREIRKKMEEFFTDEEVPRRVKEALAVAEREIEERIRSIRTVIGASTLGRNAEVISNSGVRAGDIRRWKKAVVEAMEERVRRRNLGAEHDLERRRYDGLFVDGAGRREVSKDRRPEMGEQRMFFGCGERGHLKKDCKGSKKDKGPQGRDS